MTRTITPDERAAMRRLALTAPQTPGEHAYVEHVPRLLDALDTAEADLDGFANAVSQWKRRALDAEAEVARLRAATSPAWDEDAVTEAVARALRARLPLTPEPALDATATAQADIALAVVRRHLPVSGESRAQVEAAALRAFARSINLEEIGNEWEGTDPDRANDLHWAASNAASAVQMGLYARADRIEKGETP